MRRKHPIDALIDAKVTKIEGFERSIAKLRIEVAALQQARTVLTENDSAPVSPKKQNGAEPQKRRGRSISNAWKAVLASIAVHGSTGATLDHVEKFCEGAGISLKRPTLRAQMSNYVKAGYLERGSLGQFSTTLKGMQIAGDHIKEHEDSVRAENETGTLR